MHATPVSTVSSYSYSLMRAAVCLMSSAAALTYSTSPLIAGGISCPGLFLTIHEALPPQAPLATNRKWTRLTLAVLVSAGSGIAGLYLSGYFGYSLYGVGIFAALGTRRISCCSRENGYARLEDIHLTNR